MCFYLARRVDSVAWTVLVAPCLLMCLACATPFPIERLETGMTAEGVREAVGEPEAIEAQPGGTTSSWEYEHEEFDLLTTVVTLPWTPLFPALVVLFDIEWNDFYTQSREVILHFEEDHLARWEVLGRRLLPSSISEVRPPLAHP